MNRATGDIGSNCNPICHLGSPVKSRNGWGKPNRNADPDPRAPSFASIPAKHERPFRGSNGELRFSAGGIDFITAVAGDARAWRWADIQTVANPDPYHFRVAGYLETYEFELREPMSAQSFDRLWA
jgi:hypothetical protein